MLDLVKNLTLSIGLFSLYCRPKCKEMVERRNLARLLNVRLIA
jgi:hypothetical protein